MKKLLYTLLAISIIFSACEKEEDNNSSVNNNNNNNNNNSNLVLEQTVWQLQSFEVNNSYFGDSILTYTIPGNFSFYGGEMLSVRWTFYNDNGWLVQEYTGSNETITDTSIYSFFPGINIINLDYNGFTTEFSFTNLGQDNNLVTSLSIISYANNNLVCEGIWEDDCYNDVTIRFYLTQIN